MPIKKDGTGKRWVEMEFVVSGTPEQVWHAMATGPGYTAWFTKASIEERVGGSLQFQFGPGAVSSGEVVTWQPPNYFGYVERNWNGAAPDLATEITISARSGSKCLVRMVHSLFSCTDDWDDEMEGFETGWPGFLAVLHVYLKHFAGHRTATCFQVSSSTSGEHLETWRRLLDALGLAGANVGERRTTLAKPEQLSGVVERTDQGDRVRLMLLRLEEPQPGIALLGTRDAGGRVNVSVAMYLYGDDGAGAAESERKWRAWLSETFPAAAG
ncbi:MAG: SRPBCC domain-containing protein [Pseudomonadota bacterium]|nr:SRPBCC domain-containing protein [Pseudomonadota bacterium]